jgi:hypothetical protein
MTRGLQWAAGEGEERASADVAALSRREGGIRLCLGLALKAVRPGGVGPAHERGRASCCDGSVEVGVGQVVGLGQATVPGQNVLLLSLPFP